MVMTDPIADMLTRIRNANQMRHDKVEIPASKLKVSVLEVLKKEGFINSFVVNTKDKPTIVVSLKYTKDNERVIKGIKRISKPGLRVYASATDIPRVLNGLGIAVLSTSQGILTDRDARQANTGGEVLAYVW